MTSQILDISAGGQHQRPRKTEMGEQCFSLLREQGFAVTEQCQLYVAQRKAHHPAAGRVGADQTAQAGLGRHDGMPGLFGQRIAASVAAGDRIADAAGGNQRSGCPQRLAPVGNNTCAGAVFQQQLFGAAAYKVSIPPVGAQRCKNIRGTVAFGEHPAPALGFQRYPEGFKQLHGRRRRESIQAGVQEPPVVAHVGQKFPHIAVAGDVAASLAGDEQLLPRALGIVFQHRDPQAPGTGSARRHQACGATAHNQKIGHAAFSFRFFGAPNAATDTNA